MAKGYTLNSKEMIKEGTLKHWDGKKNTIIKNMGKYHRLFFFLKFLNYI